MNRKRKVFCFGLDGATWKVLRPLVERGDLPVLASLINQGVAGELRSTQPPLTPAAWSSFQTGCNPGKHGIIDFVAFDRDRHSSHFVNATSLRVPTLWQILSSHNYRVAVVDLPVTYPPPRVNGVIISGLMTPNRESPFIHPAALRDELETHLGYPWPLLQEKQDEAHRHRDFSAFLGRMQQFIDSRISAMDFLLRREAFDVGFVQLQCIDFLQHPFWNLLDPEHPHYELAAHRLAVEAFFKPIDEAMGRLLRTVHQTLGEETLIIALSDHGFQTHEARAELNHYLYQQGFIVPQDQPLASWAKWVEVIRTVDVLELRKKMLRKSQKQAINQRVSTKRIDHQRSKAWAVSSFWGYVFLGESITAFDRQRLVEALYRWQDPRNQRKVVKAVYRKEEIYHGSAIDNFPDILVEPQAGYTFSSKTYFRSGSVILPVQTGDAHTGTHAMEGIFVVSGNEVKPSEPWQELKCDIMDFVPTILAWLGLPVPTHCDGQVRNEWFARTLSTKMSDYHAPRNGAMSEVRLSEKEENEIAGRLQQLGYL